MGKRENKREKEAGDWWSAGNKQAKYAVGQLPHKLPPTYWFSQLLFTGSIKKWRVHHHHSSYLCDDMVILQPAVGVFINLALSDNYREQLILLPKRGSISVTNKPSYMVIVGMISRSGEESIICPELAATNQSQFPRVTFPGHDEPSFSGGFHGEFHNIKYY